MRQYVIWLIFLQFCGSEYVDYSDYHPKNIPLQNTLSLQAESPSPEYNAIMKNLCDNWKSPISYLQKRGYMPTDGEDKTELDKPEKHEDEKDKPFKGANYFFFPQNIQQDSKAADGGSNTESPSTESTGGISKNDAAGIINKVREKFLSIFAHSGHDEENNNKISQGDLLDWNYDLDGDSFLENSNDYELSDKRLFVRSAPEKTTIASSSPNDELFYNLSDTDILYVKSFIDCFKQSKKDFLLQPLTAGATTTSKPSENTTKSGMSTTTSKTSTDSKEEKQGDPKLCEPKPNDEKSNDGKPNDGKPNDGKPNDGKPNDGKPNDGKPNDGKPSDGKPNDGKPNNGKPNDGKPNDGKPNDGKPNDGKPNDGKPNDEKPKDGKPSNGKPNDEKPKDGKPNDGKPNDEKPKDGKPKDGKPKPSDAKPSDTKTNASKTGIANPTSNGENLPECEPPVKTPETNPKAGVAGTTPNAAGPTTPKPLSAIGSKTTECITEASLGLATPKPPGGVGKTTHDDFTVDLDINQKNGTGEEARAIEICKCVPNVLETSTLPPCPDRSKYVTKSMFLAHLHHMVDEVGKPPHKPLDLNKIQNLIDNTKKNTSTVIMGDGKTTDCAPMRLNDMSFDLEWNKIEKSPEKDRERMSNFDLTYAKQQPQGQSLAAKFLQDVIAYPNNNQEYLKTPYSDNFLDSQQSLPDGMDAPAKVSTKREAVLPSSASHSHKLSKLLSDIASLPDPKGDDEYYSNDEDDEDAGETSRPRIKTRLKVRGKKKLKNKFRNGSPRNPSEQLEADPMALDLNEDDKKNENDFNSFEELKDIQFRVNDDDEEAISRFISNLNSPPEVFSFDVDKYLRSAELEMKPQAPELEYPSVEPRTYYEFMETPSIDKERLPLIEAPAEAEEEPAAEKRTSRTSQGKRDLLRQYIKGVSSALDHNFPELGIEISNSRANEDKSQRSPNLDTDLSFRTNNLVDGFSSSLDAMNYIKSNERDDFLDNFYLLNDGSSQIYDLAKQDPDVIPSDRYSPQSLEIDLELDKKFRDLGIGSYNGAERLQQNQKNGDDEVEIHRQMERRDFGSMNDDY